jgi:hypothetical protein
MLLESQEIAAQSDLEIRNIYSRMLEASDDETPNTHMIIYTLGLLEKKPELIKRIIERGENGTGFKIFYKLNLKSRKKPMVADLIDCELRGVTVKDDNRNFGLHWCNIVGIDIHESLKQ